MHKKYLMQDKRYKLSSMFDMAKMADALQKFGIYS